MNQIIKYEPQLEIITKDEEIYYAPVTRKAELLNVLNTQKFIDLNGVIISCYSVVKVREAKNKAELSDYSPEIRKQVQNRAKSWSENLNKQPPNEKLIEWAQKLQRGESIF